ncbi:MAG: 50S ribosomal protein L11 methyltransferase [Planctomycetes bacterium]|nr:50S ribosomal protein L11 methyltransferase [Planctomycetota bacterium]
MRPMKILSLIGFSTAVAFFLAIFLPVYSQEKPAREPDVIYVPTPHEVVDKMLDMADVRPGEVVYDLGCGDGRIPVAASKKYGVRSWGFDINPVRVKESLENVEKANVKHLCTIKQQDIFELDLSKADVITLYLLPQLNVKLIPQLDKLKPGCRIVSHDFDMKGVRPKREITYSPQGGREHRIYLWVTPLEKENRN